MNVRRTPIEHTNPAVNISDVAFAHAIRGAIDSVLPAPGGFDPRSPTVGLARTPITASNAPAGFDPRSPTVGFARTPIGNGYHAAPVGWDPRSPTVNIARTPVAGGPAPVGFDPRSPTVALARTPVPKVPTETSAARMTGGAVVRAQIEGAAAAIPPAAGDDDTLDICDDYELSVLGVGIFNAGAEPNIIEADLTERAVAPEVTTVAQDEPEDEPEDTVEAEIPGIVVTSVVAGMATETVDPPAETFRDAIDALDDIDNDGPIFREMSASMLSDLAENIENSVQPITQKTFSPTNNQRRRESQEAVRRKSSQSKVATESPGQRRAFGVLTNSPNSTRQNSKTSMFGSPSSRMGSLQNIPLPGSPKVLDLSQSQGLRRSSIS